MAKKGSDVGRGWASRAVQPVGAGPRAPLSLSSKAATTCLLSPQARVWRGRHPLLSERRPAPHAALGQRGRLAPLLPRGGCRLSPGLPGPDGHVARHPDALQSADPSDPGAEWDLRLA